jgi:hypothetical protein
MVGWYVNLHPWNRIVIAALLAVLAIKTGTGSLTIEVMIVTPLITACLWGYGWAMMSAWTRVRKSLMLQMRTSAPPAQQ